MALDLIGVVNLFLVLVDLVETVYFLEQIEVLLHMLITKKNNILALGKDFV